MALYGISPGLESQFTRIIGSNDGFIRFWRITGVFREIVPVSKLAMVRAYPNYYYSMRDVILGGIH
jgi:hypothetical protein